MSIQIKLRVFLSKALLLVLFLAKNTTVFSASINSGLEGVLNVAASSCDLRYYSKPDDKLPPQKSPKKLNSKPAPKSVTADKTTPKLQTPTPPSSDIDTWIGQYSEQYGIDKEKMKKIAYCESKFNPNAVNGPYGGMYQFHPRTWSSTRNEMGLDPNPDLRFNAEESIKTTAYKIAKQGTGPWPVCGRG